MADTIDFMKQIWGSMGAPSMVTPSLSVEDINKKISDLKTVASWLELNLNMLKATIQTMEVQSATLSTLQAMSAIMASQGTPASEAEEGAAAGSPFPFGFPMWPGASPQQDAPAADAEPQAAAPTEEPEPEPEAADAAPEAPEAPEAPAGALPDFQSAMANPNAWWNVLQEQFKHAVGNAMSSVQAEQEPLLKPVRPAAAAGTSKASKAAKSAKRSKNKTVTPPKPKARAAAPKAKPASVSRAGKAVSKPGKAASGKPAAGKVPKSAANTSASARAAVVQSRQNKKPAPRKPTSP
ncbi:PhaM family polyhydroxyalkanoate granule multifunctional regulatory protein [Herbaspirillum sp. LeCh32-8]|uniref:PhaM family polyhydroxyalkanoate granule multifunctional regulatory protein n=1 Tax=Herbaspirillum sp. LeCh32-8 TaxID=2821356 RepID=UPI0032AF4B13